MSEKVIDVLVVDDDHDCRQLLFVALSASDFLVRTAATAGEARAAIDVTSPGGKLAEAIRDDS